MPVRQEAFIEKAAGFSCRLFFWSALAEALAVGALILGGVSLVGTHHDAVQRTVVLGIAVVCAGPNGAFNTLVGIVVHDHFLL
jgi:hypothetical protein